MNNNLNCDNVCDLLELYHDDLVRPTTKEAVSNHLSECETCRKEYKKMRGTLPEIAETSTRKEFARLMKKKKTKQIVTTVICCLLACLILSSTYLILTEAHLKTLDIEVQQAYRYIAPNGQKFFFVLYTHEGNSSSSPRIEVKRDFSGNPERTAIVFDTMIPLVTDPEKDGTYVEYRLFRADEVSTHKQGVINHLDCDELIMDGEVVWLKEANEDDEIPDYVQAFYDMEYVYNQDESGDSDAMSMSLSFDSDNLFGDESYICADYPDKTIKWNLKGEVIEETLKVPSSAEY